MRDVAISGAGMTRFGKFPDRSVRSLAEEATHAALQDAGIEARDVGIVFFANAAAGLVTGQEMIRGQAALRNTGLLGLPIINVENACASAATAVHLAWSAVASGETEVALAVGAEKLTHKDKRRSFEAIGSAIDLEEKAELRARLYGIQPNLGDEEGAQPSGSAAAGVPSSAESRSLFMDIYADMARRYMESSGATSRDLAEIAVKSHEHATLNPKAQYRQRVTVEEVLGSREIASPLTLLMCSPIGDGASVLVVCSEEYAKRSSSGAVRILASTLVSVDENTDASTAARATAKAYESAALGPEDLDVVELHDAAASAELQLYEDLALCEPGGGPELVASGATHLGGRIPANPSGGLLSKGHPVGATGCAQIYELVEQLRGRAGKRQVEGARVALAENGGGFLGKDNAVSSVHILTR